MLAREGVDVLAAAVGEAELAAVAGGVPTGARTAAALALAYARASQPGPGPV